MKDIRLGNNKSKTLLGEIVLTGTHYYEGRNGVIAIWDKRYDGPCIYTITTFPNGKVYVGMCRDYSKRVGSHRKDLFLGKSCNPILQNSFNKYKFAIIKIEERCLEEELGEKEVYYINFYKSKGTPHGCNIIEGGTSTFIQTDAAKKKISLRHKGDSSSSKRTVYEYNLDGTFSREWSCAMDAVRFYGYKKSRIDQVCSFKKKSKSFMGKMWRYFKSDKLDPIRYDIDSRIVKGVQQITVSGEVLNTFDSLTAAAIATGIKRATISAALRQNRIGMGFYWKKKI